MAISSWAMMRLGPKVSEAAAMPVTTPARITPNNGRIWSGPMPSWRINPTTPYDCSVVRKRIRNAPTMKCSTGRLASQRVCSSGLRR